MKTKEVMKVLAKILSIVIVILFVYSMYGLFQAAPFVFIITELPLTLLMIIMYYPPLFYFAWSKKGESKVMKIWAKIISIILCIITLFILLLSIIYNLFSDFIALTGLPYFLSNILLLIILFYFGWFNKKSSKKPSKN